MTINSPACLANSTTTSGLVNSSALGDLRPSSRDSGGRGGGTPVACSSTTLATGGNGGTPLALDRSSPRSQRDRNERSTFGSGGIPSPLSEPIAGPSGMGPVQQVPLVRPREPHTSYPFSNAPYFFQQSLKKEIDWDRGDDKSSGDSSLDFRHPHDSVSCDSQGTNRLYAFARANACLYCSPPTHISALSLTQRERECQFSLIHREKPRIKMRGRCRKKNINFTVFTSCIRLMLFVLLSCFIFVVTIRYRCRCCCCCRC